MTPDEIARIGVDEALVFISKQNVFRDKKAMVTDHPMKDELSDNPNDGNGIITFVLWLKIQNSLIMHAMEKLTLKISGTQI